MIAFRVLALKTPVSTGAIASGKQTGNTTTPATENTTGTDGGSESANFQRLLAAAYHVSPQPITTDAKDQPATQTGTNGQPLLTRQAAADLANGADDAKGKNTTDSADLEAAATNSTAPVKSQTDDKTDSKTDNATDQYTPESNALLAKSGTDPVTKPVSHTPTTIVPTVIPIAVPTPQSSSGEGTANTAINQNAAGRASTGTDNNIDRDVRASQGTSANGNASGTKSATHAPTPEINVEVNEGSEAEQSGTAPTSLRDLAAKSAASQITVSTTPPQVLQAINRSTVTANPEKRVATVTVPATSLIEGNTQATTQLADTHAQQPTATSGTVGSTTPVATQIADAVVSKAGFMQQGGTTDIYLHLNPPELGTVNLHSAASGDTLTARVVVSSDATRSMIEQQLPDLRARLGESGITLGGFDVAQQHQNAQQQTAQQQEIPQVDYGSSTLPRVATIQGSNSQTQRSGQLDVLV